jgi:hypothetical protein
MHSANFRKIPPALALIAFCVICSCSFAQERPVPWLAVDIPLGGCRLSASEDGSASIHYGAVARRVEVQPGTFNLEKLTKTLRAKSYQPTAYKTERAPDGSLSLPDESGLLFHDDYEFVRSLLERAWGARVPPKTPEEVEAHAWISNSCSLK